MACAIDKTDTTMCQPLTNSTCCSEVVWVNFCARRTIDSNFHLKASFILST